MKTNILMNEKNMEELCSGQFCQEDENPLHNPTIIKTFEA
jgi:hypothetical protein